MRRYYEIKLSDGSSDYRSTKQAAINAAKKTAGSRVYSPSGRLVCGEWEPTRQDIINRRNYDM